jgi:hypothetical protein
LRAIQNVCHHPGTFLKFHDGDGVRRFKTRNGAMVDHITVKRRPPGCLKHFDTASSRVGAKRAGREISFSCVSASLQKEFSPLAPFPKVVRLGRGLRQASSKRFAGLLWQLWTR